MQRYFTEEANWNDETVCIKGDDAHHIVRVMRKKLGDQIILNHPSEKAALGEITNILERTVEVKVVEWIQHDAELPVQVTIAQGLPKGNKLELILQKGTELGASQFLIFEGDRSIAKWDERKSKQRLKRYEKIMKEASEQSHRNMIPDIQAISLENILANQSDYDIILYAYEEEAKKEQHSSFGNLLSKVKQEQRILLFIGPEGGFTDREVQLFEKYGCHSVRLGARILRTETAAMYVLASISYHFEELGCHKCHQP